MKGGHKVQQGFSFSQYKATFELIKMMIMVVMMTMMIMIMMMMMMMIMMVGKILLPIKGKLNSNKNSSNH